MGDRYHDEDQELWLKVRENADEKSFNALYEKYGSDVYANTFSLLKDRARAQDVTQDVFVHLWQNRQRFYISNFKSYLFVAVRNRILRILEKEKRVVSFEDLLRDESDMSIEESSDYLTLKHEFLQAYRRLLDALPRQRRKIFDSYFDKGLSTEEIAGELSLSRKTVQNQLGRAVSYLKTNLSHLSALLLIFFF